MAQGQQSGQQQGGQQDVYGTFVTPEGKADLNQGHVQELWAIIETQKERLMNGSKTQQQLYAAFESVIPQAARSGSST